MRARLVEGGLFTGLLAGIFFGGGKLMDHTLSRHQDVPPGSELVVELKIATHSGAEAGKEEIAEALIVACQLEVRGSVRPDTIQTIVEGHYRFVMRPGLDESDRRQLVGCLQDMRIDNVLGDVVSMEQR